MNYLRQHPFITAILVNIILFSIVFTCCFPIFNSGDDVYLMYLSGGGFGSAPTELLHYQYGMHPLIGWLVKTAFVQFPAFNWYSFLLYSLHFIACCIILLRSIKKNELVAGLGYYFLFFVIELFFLLQPSFTNTAMVTAVAGALLIYTSVQQKQSVWKMLPGFALLLVAALLRLHMLIPVAMLAAPFIIAAIKRPQALPILLSTLALAVIIVIAFFVQSQYYIKNIPGWQQEEAYRQTVIDHYNVPKKPANTIRGDLGMRADFLEKGILWDRDFLSQAQVAATTKAIRVSSAASQGDFRQRLFWLLIESRMGLLLMLFTFLLKNSSFSKPERAAALISAGVFLLICALLILFRKLPGYIVTGGMLQWITFVIMSGGIRPKPNPNRPVIIGAAMVIMVWGVIRINKLNQSNIGQYGYWTCAYEELSFHKDKLLIVTDDRFPADYFHLWDVPKKYPLENVLTKDHFLNNTYHAAFKKFGIQSLDTPGKVSFIGTPSAILEKYYENKNGRGYEVIPASRISNCIKIWELD